MKINLVVELEDKPGQLLKVLTPIAKYGGNIIGIVHNRKVQQKSVLVDVVFEIAEDKADKLLEEIKSSGITIRKVNEIKLTEKISVLLVGHIIHTDISDTINRIDSTGFAEVTEMDISMPELNKPSTALLTISAVSKEKLEEALKILRNVCEEKKIKVVEPLNEEA
ncbi:amino acid-binding ACT domain protein [Ferroglobus placidus DSM 10642]|uniref:Amino acid-binding ACT domain protein n=1 Tax=Ferroglobus placidus (strain DSM 10642 / AEDII12DO) TaxID=589924 RepID=D3S117_FERPA|nr:ACT domain-containing protein [Ferroglobus placidus]ADC64253.1 amino acid-binding ACT domain protein [Ferroglobus placidus DSM 10642]